MPATSALVGEQKRCVELAGLKVVLERADTVDIRGSAHHSEQAGHIALKSDLADRRVREDAF